MNYKFINKKGNFFKIDVANKSKIIKIIQNKNKLL